MSKACSSLLVLICLFFLNHFCVLREGVVILPVLEIYFFLLVFIIRIIIILDVLETILSILTVLGGSVIQEWKVH